MASHIKMYKTREFVEKNGSNIRNYFERREILLSGTWGEIVFIILNFEVLFIISLDFSS